MVLCLYGASMGLSWPGVVTCAALLLLLYAIASPSRCSVSIESQLLACPPSRLLCVVNPRVSGEASAMCYMYVAVEKLDFAPIGRSADIVEYK